MFECIKSPEVKEKVKDRIAKKLSAIKLPYFIEDLAIAELNLGNLSLCKVELNVREHCFFNFRP